MKAISRIFLVSSLIIISGTVYQSNACPFTLTNDGDAPILIVDPHGRQAVRIKPGKQQVIDPTLRGWFWKYFSNEKLNIYVQRKKSDMYQLKYQLIEKYCTEKYKTENNLTLTDIISISKQPTKRLIVKTFEIEHHKPHQHLHHSH